MKNKFLFIISLTIVIFGCRKNPVDTDIDPTQYNPDWTSASHENVSPDYNVVFPQNSVNKIEIVLGTEKWNAIKNNMFTIYGIDFGANVGGGNVNSLYEPEYVDGEMRFNGKIWKNVGFRLKGNSTLRSAWNSGNYKLPFRLNFDKFEDQYPGIKNQHFYGFEELSFSPGFKDASLIREKLASDIYRLGGIVAARTAFYRVYVDIGTGLKYWGLYCGVELPDDNMLQDQLGEESGNIYKPESRLNIFSPSEFVKVNNETENDYTDVANFVAALNSPLRISNNTQWKSNLENVFNVDKFLQWLAINNGMVNWDSYGAMAHNYYLYHHSDGKLIWMPWDNNEAMTRNPGIVGATGGNSMNGMSLSMNEVTANWPLIRYLADDPVYMNRYKDLIKTFKNNVYNNTTVDVLIDDDYNLITPFVIGTDGEQLGYSYLTNSAAFTNERANLKSQVSSRNLLITTFVP
jgi:hypothetical protein